MRAGRTRGAVLLFVLALVALLASLAVTTIRTAQVEVFATYGGIYARQARATVESGLLAAAAVLLPPRPADSDNLTQDWAFFPDLASYPGVSFLDGHVSGRIEDESGKFPVNAMHPGLSNHAAYQAVFLRLLTGEALALPEDRAKALLAALTDWLDADDQPGAGGAEDAAYAAAQLPYHVRNNSLDTLGELLLIQGFSRDLLCGRGDRPGLLSLLTVWGSGLINVNTTPLPVLAALPSGLSAAQAAAQARSLDAYRRDPVRQSELASLEWLTKAAGSENGQWPTTLLTTRSLYYAVTLEGRSGVATARLFTVLKRDQSGQSGKPPHCMVLYRELR
ncbi:MAG TPA: type II secretion system minor pseudopilin GspK [Solidesulfovibrio magneticus]|nr:type II secretion system minor pseudopilin GspK [Solidesulfovibrio magneticus]